MKVTVINKDKKKDDYSLVYSIILLILGIFLAFNSEGLLNIIFTILGAFVILFGIYKFSNYFRLKTQLGTDDASLMMSGILWIASGLLIVLLSSFLTNAIQVVTGIWLFFIGINKLSSAVVFKDIDQKSFIIQLISSIVLILLGVYTIFTDNVVFIFIGAILIVYSVADIINYFMRKK